MSIATESALKINADFMKLLHDLGDIDPARICMSPLPGTVTFEMFLNYMETHEKPICEWVHNTIVEKAMGAHESRIGGLVVLHLGGYIDTHDLGIFYIPDGVLRVHKNAARAADIAFVSWSRLPGGKAPDAEDRIPNIAPNLMVEILSFSNTKREMKRKRQDYFQAGVDLVWEIDPDSRTAKAYTDVDEFEEIPTDGVLDGGDVLPGYQLSLAALFAKLDGKRTQDSEDNDAAH